MIKVGVIGAGYWGPNHIRNFQASRRAKVVAFAERDQKRRESVAKRFLSVEPMCDPEQLLARDDIQAVVIVTPTSSHYELVKMGLIRGKDVLCEKPLTMKADESKELIDLAEKAGLILMVGHTFIYNDGIRALHDRILDGEIGAPLYLHLRRTNLGPIRQDVNVVYDLASHDVYIANYLLNGHPEHVVACGGVYLQPNLVDVAFITLKYRPNILVNIHVSWLDPRKERLITVIGDKKMIVWDDLSAETIKVYDKSVEIGTSDYDSFGQFHLMLKEGNVVIPKLKLNEPLANQTDHFIDCVEKRSRPLSSGEEGLAVVRVLEMIQRSINANDVEMELNK